MTGIYIRLGPGRSGQRFLFGFPLFPTSNPLPTWGGGGVKYRMLHIPGILDCTYHLHVSCLCAQGSSIAEYLDYSP